MTVNEEDLLMVWERMPWEIFTLTFYTVVRIQQFYKIIIHNVIFLFLNLEINIIK